jgi:hypothetical protein
VVDTSYAVLHWLYFDRGVKLPPEKIWVDAQSGALRLEDPQSGEVARFGYDAFPIFWRVALDAKWNWRLSWLDADLVPLLRKLRIEPKGKAAQAELARLTSGCSRRCAPSDREHASATNEISGERSQPRGASAYAGASLAELADPPLRTSSREEALGASDESSRIATPTTSTAGCEPMRR